MSVSALRQWLDGLSPRDRNVLIAGSAVLLVLLLYAFVWDPLQMDHARLRESIPGLRAQATRFDALAGEAERLRGSARGAAAPAGPAAIEAAADRTGVRASIKSIEQQSGGKVQVAIEGVGYDALLAWIADVASSAGMSVDSIQVQRGAAPGAVSVPSLVFKGWGGA